MIQKNGRRIAGVSCLVRRLAVAGAMLALWCQPFVSRADFTGTVAVDYATIRENTDTSSTAIGSVARGKTITIKEEVQDASGAAWYRVYVDSNTLGYIRADLINRNDGGAGEAAPDDGGQNAAQNEAQSGAAQAETAMEAQYAAVSQDAIKVRTGPSTRNSIVDRLVRDAQVIISGQSAGSDGKTWYYVAFTGADGVEKTGFVRSDLVTLGDMVPVQEEEVPEEPEVVPEPEETVSKDYEVSYDQEEDGSYAWYLHDNVAGYRQKLQPLLDATQVQDEDASADAKVLVRQRIVIVVLIFLVLALIVAVIVMGLKLRDVYYEDYEDDDEEQEEEVSSKRRTREGERESARRGQPGEEDAASARRGMRGEEEEPSARRRRRLEENEEPVKRRRSLEAEEDTLERTARRKSARDARRSAMREVEYREDRASDGAVNAAPKRKAKNFLLDDDEFEFEFLNMDDKDL